MNPVNKRALLRTPKWARDYLSRKDYVGIVSELRERCEKLTSDLTAANNALRQKEAELARMQSRYALSEQTSKEYQSRAERAELELTAAKVRAEKAEREMDAVNRLLEAAERSTQSDSQRANTAERKYLEMEQYMNNACKEYESFRDRLKRMDV